jgi:hypothetical protein
LQTESFDVFVSYARVDSRHAADIDTFLRAQGLSSFFDRRNLSPGLPWLRGLEKALKAAKAAIILIGPKGLGNTQQYERDFALIRQTGDPSFPIVPVLLPGAERPSDFLQILTWIDFSQVAKVSELSAELEQLVAAVQGGQKSACAVAQPAICPYRGLDAFREEDSALFFGRGSADDPESPIGQLVRKVRDHPLVMVVGGSGRPRCARCRDAPNFGRLATSSVFPVQLFHAASHARARRPLARRVVLELPAPGGAQRRPLARSCRGAYLRAAHGVHAVRDRRG